MIQYSSYKHKKIVTLTEFFFNYILPPTNKKHVNYLNIHFTLLSFRHIWQYWGQSHESLVFSQNSKWDPLCPKKQYWWHGYESSIWRCWILAVYGQPLYPENMDLEKKLANPPMLEKKIEGWTQKIFPVHCFCRLYKMSHSLLSWTVCVDFLSPLHCAF